MLARALTLVFALLLAVALVGLRRATHDVVHYRATLPGDVPAVVYEPGPPRAWGAPPPRGTERMPAIVLAHGFSSSKGMMSTLARHFARAGYAVVAFDARGHGENANPFQRSPDGAGLDVWMDAAAAIEFARGHPRFDPDRVFAIGHSMGAAAVLEAGSREPSLAGVVAISGAQKPSGPYRVPNVFLIWAQGDPASLREHAGALGAELAGLERLVLDRSYGDAERGEAVRASEVDGVDHLTILYSQEAARRVIEWLDPLASRTSPPVQSDGRLLWVVLGFLGFVGLLPPLARVLATLVPVEPAPAPDRPLARLGAFAAALAAALVLLAGADAYTGAEPARFVPVMGARDLFAFFAASGLLLAAPLARSGRLRGRGLRAPRTWLVAALTSAFGYVALGSAVAPLTDLWLAPHRLGPAVLGALLAIPYFASSELLLRGSGARGALLPIAGKLLTLAALAGGAMLGLVSFIVILALGSFAILFVVFEITAWSFARHSANPWPAVLAQSAWTGWTLAATFPITA